MIRKLKEYPIYQLHDNALYAFLGKSDMYEIRNGGSNSGAEGIVINHFITRRMVIKHLNNSGYDISIDYFREKYNAIFRAISIRLTGQ